MAFKGLLERFLRTKALGLRLPMDGSDYLHFDGSYCRLLLKNTTRKNGSKGQQWIACCTSHISHLHIPVHIRVYIRDSYNNNTCTAPSLSLLMRPHGRARAPALSGAPINTASVINSIRKPPNGR
ncbi:hypothetical protein EVAR_28617_1 [Eumeta japonica]|uniref:Uncharacterized protein n=1 Tax=Eumeta variegata TaxID=151549 RepID=A0A4C1XUG0_EUMVA|nr:hypothetical protein EVAR_28617_1 [Eumeta japonica]